MQGRKIRYDVIGLTETRRHRPLNATFDTGEELFVGTCDSRGVGGVGVVVKTNLVLNIDSFELLTIRIERLRLRRCGSMPDLTIFVAYAPTSSYDGDEIEAFYMDLEKSSKRQLSYDTLEPIRQRGATRVAGNYRLTSELAKWCREAIKKDLKERREAVLAGAS
ncbi:hypothetical protein ANCDUO_04458 [Ancylostoma duodenale]|uniref:Uncharacterized protein n=1 Tax=Ancylostoma duodenale TaxID=51022 RepID=A0A0C2H6Y5_9BILA|nr:hypothetical protein ANCDUO_04458 [Ancylostoma duodenale]